MNDLIKEILKWPAIIQGILGSAIFAFCLWLLKLIYVKITNSIKKVRINREFDELTKFYIHKYFVNTRGLFYFTQGYLLVIYKVLRGMIEAIIICVFWILVTRIIDSNPFIDMLFGGIIIYKMIDLKGWFYPKLSKGNIENYDPLLVEKVKNSLLDDHLKERDLKQEKNSKVSEVKKLQSEISILSRQLMGDEMKSDEKNSEIQQASTMHHK